MKLTEHCHQLLLPYCQKALVAVDATFGNGNDILFLAQQLPLTAKIFGFDIQAQAFQKTTLLLSSQKINNCQLFLEGHENLKKILADHEVDSVDIIMFNLGYLPQGDKSITTTFSNSIFALDQSLGLLNSNGIISLMIYPGHPAGEVESEEIKCWLNNLPKNYQCNRLENYPNKASSPYLLLITKR